VTSGLDAVDAGRQHRDAERQADALDEACRRADHLGRMAIGSARRIAALEAQVRSLQACLAQRQAFIDAVKSGKIVLPTSHAAEVSTKATASKSGRA